MLDSIFGVGVLACLVAVCDSVLCVCCVCKRWGGVWGRSVSWVNSQHQKPLMFAIDEVKQDLARNYMIGHRYTALTHKEQEDMELILIIDTSTKAFLVIFAAHFDF